MPDLEALRLLYKIRRVEEEIARRYYPDPNNKLDSPMRCPVHLSIGQESVAVGVALAVPPGSHAYSTHRCHAHYLAWGGNLDRMIAELYGKATGCSGGLAGSMHLHDESVGFMGTSAIVGSSISLAVGDAFSAKLNKSNRITVAFGGDAVLETGQFWESLNLARLHKLSILFLIEDNGLSTATVKGTRQSKNWGSGFARCAKDDVSTVKLAVERLPLPYVLIVRTTRHNVHVGVEHHELPPLKPVWDDIEAEIDSAFRKAEVAPWP